ncbi:DUF3293 domain-containing protein [Ferrovibrio sp. MS7]|jgi:hypothetical protein|uniref:DUF3293 domain-containing protein n=1 Tax=Ferrovibrio plantarum TaxID=3119164 RepID=UPI003135351B
MRPSLARAYRTTAYAVVRPSNSDNGAAELVLHPDRYDPATDAWLRAERVNQAVLLTAWNPASRRHAATENHAADAALKAWLDKGGYRWLPAEYRATDPAWTEAGVAILGMPRRIGTILARQLGQNALLFTRLGSRPQLIRTRRNSVDESLRLS